MGHMHTNSKLQNNSYFLKTFILLFLFGSAQLLLAQSPGGVSSDLSVWLKADSEVFSDTGITDAVNNGTVHQ
ncbi:hypothetical protein HPE56_19205 [Maribacter sp. ANRC-HE7]|uniref:Uncharacterized protein n=1 Tax=Maribacter aquimaris TaxID=2737171 RepID=A0ABR7V650_9FLAO|nr:hypothetical protein [Maribacter aquimaris]MBD0779932.1 hypothetical protein [Maribacter aquimaris]